MFKRIKFEIKASVSYLLIGLAWFGLAASLHHFVGFSFAYVFVSQIIFIFISSYLAFNHLKEREHSVRIDKLKFRELANSSPVMLWLMDTNDNILYHNRAWILFRGLKPDKKSVATWKDSIHPDDFDRVYNQTYKTALITKNNFTIEYRMKRFDGSYHWMLETIIPKFDSKNRFEGIFGSTIDISERKTLEDITERQEKLNQRIAQLSPDYIFIYDLQLKKNIYHNRNFTEWLGYNPREFKILNERVILRLIHPDDINKVRYNDEYIHEIVTNGIREGEYRMKAKSGEYRWIQTRETVFSQDENGRIIQVLGSARDITERKIVENSLQDLNNDLQIANEELDGFVYRASHDLKAPLTSVLGLINISKHINKDKSINLHLDMMQRSIGKLMHVIQDLIDHSRNVRTEIFSEPINLKDMIKSIIDTLKYQDKASEIDFIITGETTIPFYSDRVRLEMMLNNLISNAIKYHDYKKEHPYLKIHIMVSSTSSQITISDNGIGIEKQHQDKIFNMFFRVSNKSTGSGLGLYIVKGVLEKLKGSVIMKSEQNVGTTFEIEIPNLKIENNKN
jgi:PAS domain S-box-containing protein